MTMDERIDEAIALVESIRNTEAESGDVRAVELCLAMFVASMTELERLIGHYKLMTLFLGAYRRLLGRAFPVR